MMPNENSSPRSTDLIPWNILLPLQITHTGTSYGSTLIWGEALIKDPERPINSEVVWYHV